MGIWCLDSCWRVGVGVVRGSRFLCTVLALLEEGEREIFVWIMWYIYVNIDGSYPDILIILHTFACSFVVLSIAEKAQGGGGGVIYSTLYFSIKDRMNMRNQVDGRLPYKAPSAELFALTAASPSLLVSFSANIDEDFDDGTWVTDVIADDNSF